MGPLAWNTPFSTFEETVRGAATNDVAALADKRLITASEVKEHARLNEARIKALSGGDAITARFNYKEFFEYEPTFKIWLAVNHLPHVSDDSEGFWRRVRRIPFLASFEGAAADLDLQAKLESEVVGILTWLVSGCLEWRRRGRLEEPQCVKDATAEYRADSDPISDFLAECCTVGPEQTATAADLYKAYVAYADKQGFGDQDRLKPQGLGRRLRERFEQDRTKGARFYRGIGIKVTV